MRRTKTNKPCRWIGFPEDEQRGGELANMLGRVEHVCLTTGHRRQLPLTAATMTSLTNTKCVSQMTTDIFVCRNHNPVISSIMTSHRVPLVAQQRLTLLERLTYV